LLRREAERSRSLEGPIIYLPRVNYGQPATLGEDNNCSVGIHGARRLVNAEIYKDKIMKLKAGLIFPTSQNPVANYLVDDSEM